MRRTLSLLIPLALGLTACQRDDSTSATSTSAKPTGSAPAPGAAAMSDPQIAAIVVAANQVDIDAGKLALQKAKNDEVRAFAQQMITDHTAVNKSATDLVSRLKVTPEPSDASRGLTTEGKDTMAKLERLEGDAFDRAYIDNEVAYHQKVIGVLDSQLIPSATNPELRSTLVGVKPAFDAHLQHAKQLQSKLGR
jgi:putative membrane protein